MYPILPIRGKERLHEIPEFPRTLPVRPARGIKRYEDHLDYHRYARIRRDRQEEESPGKPAGRMSFPYAKEAEIDSAAQFARAVASVLTAAAGLKIILEDFRGTGGGSILLKRSVRSSAPEAVTAEALHGAELQTFRVAVRRLASSQLIRTAYYTPNAPTTVEPGFNRLRLVTGGMSRELDLLILSGDTHRTVLTRLRNSWNENITGIRAYLETDSGTGRLRLGLEGSSPGSAHAFVLEDLVGNTAGATGLRVLDRAASDAEIRIDDGDPIVHPSNRIHLAREKLLLHLHGISQEPATLTVEPDTAAIAAKLGLLSANVLHLKSELDQAAEYINPAFVNYLDYDTAGDRLTEMARMLYEHYPEVVNQLSAPDGIPAGLSRLVSRMEQAPAEMLLNRGHTRYKRYANYLASLDWYSQLPSQGLLLNRFL